jgi:hypothetical protein
MSLLDYRFSLLKYGSDKRRFIGQEIVAVGSRLYDFYPELSVYGYLLYGFVNLHKAVFAFLGGEGGKMSQTAFRLDDNSLIPNYSNIVSLHPMSRPTVGHI